MQESLQDIEAFSIDSSIGSEVLSLPPILPTTQCAEKVKTYQTKAENINVLQNADTDAKRSSFECGDNVDNVLSGESLYKTFTFEQTSDEDVEKCIAFWKSVMQKNLEPIKCSIIESSKTKVEGEPVTKKSLDISEELNKTAKNTEEKIHNYYRNLFTTTLKELQKRRLNEIKLIGKSHCKMCEPSIDQEEDEDIDQSEEISGLNNWEPKSIEKNKSVSQKPTDGEGSLKLQKPTKTPDCICEPKAPQDVDSVDTIVSDRVRIIPKSNRYKLINIIDKKRRTGAYSQWRENITEPCICGIDTCTCNLNPAIVSWKSPDETCGCGQLHCQCKNLKQSGDQTKDEKVTDVELREQCKCGDKDCTCSLPQLVKSQETVQEVLSSSAPVDDIIENISIKSKETIIAELGETKYQHTDDLYHAGPIKKSSKADVTKCEDTNRSRTTLTSNNIVPETECRCEEKCDNCLKQRISNSKITENKK